MRKIYTTLVLVLCYGFTSAQTIVTDRPDQTESSSTVGHGELQIESGILFGSSKDDFDSEDVLLAPTILWRYGIVKGIELRLLTEFTSVKDKFSSTTYNGFTDLQLGTKIQLLKKEEVRTEIALLSAIIIPSAKDELSNGTLGATNKLSISHDFGASFALGYNVGYDYLGFGSGNLTYSIAFGYSLSDKMGCFIEPYGALLEFDNHESSVNAGLTYLLKDHLQFDLSAGTGINHSMNFISLGCSINIDLI